MATELVIFFILGIIAVVTSIAVITSKNPVYAVIFLVINFFTIAMLYLVLSAQFIAFMQILVYAGAIMVLFLFVVMLLNLTGAIEQVQDRIPAQKWIAIVCAVALLIEAGVIIGTRTFQQPAPTENLPANFGYVAPVGSLLYARYLLPFEATSVLLLIAMIGSLVMARRRS
jgi:NADH-quinone oxidoreductase subunit J